VIARGDRHAAMGEIDSAHEVFYARAMDVALNSNTSGRVFGAVRCDVAASFPLDPRAKSRTRCFAVENLDSFLFLPFQLSYPPIILQFFFFVSSLIFFWQLKLNILLFLYVCVYLFLCT